MIADLLFEDNFLKRCGYAMIEFRQNSPRGSSVPFAVQPSSLPTAIFKLVLALQPCCPADGQDGPRWAWMGTSQCLMDHLAVPVHLFFLNNRQLELQGRLCM